MRIDLKWAQTIDGQLCDDSGSSQWISSDPELAHTHYLRSQYQGVLVGATTFLKDRAQLTVRHYKGFQGDQPVRIILDPRDRVFEALNSSRAEEVSRLLCEGDRPTLVLGGGKGENHPSFENPKLVYQKSPMDLSKTNGLRQQLEFAIKSSEELLSRSFESIMVEGGPRVLTYLAQAGAFDKIYVSLASKITGGNHHRIFMHRNLVNSLELKLIGTCIKGSDVVLEYEAQS